MKAIVADINDDLQKVAARYAVGVTDHVRSTINPADLADPVARQYLPSAEELTTLPQELADPIGDEAHMPVKGIVHRYPDRVLLKAVHVCAVYCRFCFRREMVGPKEDKAADMLTAAELSAAIDYIRHAPKVREVILTGGDPLVLSPRRLTDIMAELSAIPHLDIIRFHTRVPVADPARVTGDLVAAMQSDKAVYMVVHCNHANELTPPVRAAVQKIQSAGIPMLSQSVLLKGVNNDADALENLFRALLRFKIKPYYLHHPDLAPGTSHFRLPIAEGLAIMSALQGRVTGMALPRYVLDLPGGFGKVPVASAQRADNGYIFTDAQGRQHFYSDI